APWGVNYAPYTARETGDDERELPAYEIFDADGTKIFDTNEDMPAEIQEANARLAVAFPALLAACRMVIDRWQRGDLAEAARACQAAVEQATGSTPPWDITDTAPSTARRYSVLLLYPDYATDLTPTDTYYAF